MQCHFVIGLALACVVGAGRVLGCDACGTQVASVPAGSRQGAFVSVFEQYSEYDRPPEGGHAFKGYSTQFAAGYRVSPAWSLQVGVPYVDRTLDDETARGLGDATAIVSYRVWPPGPAANAGRLDLYAGLKAPTGESDLLEESREAAEAHAGSADDHGHTQSHAEDLALGSGSWDGLFGVRGLATHGRYRGTVEALYRLTTEGDFDFQYGDAFVWRAGAQYDVLQSAKQSLAAGADVTGEWSGQSEVRGEKEPDSDLHATYAGPAMAYGWRDRLTVTLAYDFPIQHADEGLHGAADRRVRGSLIYRF